MLKNHCGIQTFTGPHVWDNGRIPRRIAERDSRDGRDEGEFEIRSSRFSELRTPNVELQIAPFSHVTRHGLWRRRTFSASYQAFLRAIGPVSASHGPHPVNHDLGSFLVRRGSRSVTTLGTLRRIGEWV